MECQFGNYHPTQAILNDCDNYFHSLPKQEQQQGKGSYEFYEDGKGQHAIRFETSSGWRNYHNFLIYDTNGKRVKAMGYQ